MSTVRKRDDILNKKVPENPKYSHVKSKLDTGYSVRTHIERMKEYPRMNATQNEIFRRIQLRTLVTLMVEVAKEGQQKKPSEDQDTKLATCRSRSDVGLISHQSQTSQLQARRPVSDEHQSVLNGIGELDSKELPENSVCVIPERSDKSLEPYLLLDVRDSEQFCRSHIVTAKNYPSAMLSRSVRYETPDMMAYKNMPSKLVIVYDEDESIAQRVASTLVQRGYNNLYLLSGGLNQALKKFPCGLVVGMVSASHKPRSGTTSNRNQASVPMPLTVTDRPKTTSSLATGVAGKECLDPEDIEALRLQLDSFYISSATGGRTSVRTKSLYSVPARGVAGSEHHSSLATIKRQPWK